METKTLLSGLIGFFIGGLLVAVAATTFDKPTADMGNEMAMSGMTASLKNKTGDEYDAAFIAYMIDHHEGAIDMAKLSAQNAKHDEIKKLSGDIVKAQAAEVEQMKQWQADWGYVSDTDSAKHMQGGQ